MYQVYATPLDEGVDTMSIVRKIKRNRRPSSGRREFARALASAPTQASREELLLLQNLGR